MAGVDAAGGDVRGDLHVFLPLDDRGVDGIVHRISTDAYARLQVKGRTVHRDRGLKIQVREDELVDDRAVVVAVDLDLAAVQLKPYALVVDVPAFRQLAHRYVDKDRISYDAEVTLPPPAGSPWAPWCVPVDEIGDRLLPPGRVPAVGRKHDAIAAKRLGYRAEMELLRRAADSSQAQRLQGVSRPRAERIPHVQHRVARAGGDPGEVGDFRARRE